MAVNEKSVGKFYFAVVKIDRWYCPRQIVEIVQMHEPWRRGHAVMRSFGFRRAFVWGTWTKTLYDDIEDDFFDDRWLDPHWMDSVSADEISEWDDLSGPAEEEDSI